MFSDDWRGLTRRRGAGRRHRLPRGQRRSHAGRAAVRQVFVGARAREAGGREPAGNAGRQPEAVRRCRQGDRRHRRSSPEAREPGSAWPRHAPGTRRTGVSNRVAGQSFVSVDSKRRSGRGSKFMARPERRRIGRLRAHPAPGRARRTCSRRRSRRTLRGARGWRRESQSHRTPRLRAADRRSHRSERAGGRPVSLGPGFGISRQRADARNDCGGAAPGLRRTAVARAGAREVLGGDTAEPVGRDARRPARRLGTCRREPGAHMGSRTNGSPRAAGSRMRPGRSRSGRRRRRARPALG